MISIDPDSLTYDAAGLVPVVVQDVATGAVLMLAWADREAVARTAETGLAHFWSRSRRRPWRKGETSGNTLAVVEAAADCDRDTLLLRVHPAGPACHRDTRTCFEPAAGGPGNPARLELGWLAAVVAARRGADPAESYTARLLAGGPAAAARKLVEEATEVLIAALAAVPDGDRGSDRTAAPPAPVAEDSVAWEAADLLYHLAVVLEGAGVAPETVAAELVRRHRPAAAPPPEGGAR